MSWLSAVTFAVDERNTQTLAKAPIALPAKHRAPTTKHSNAYRAGGPTAPAASGSCDASGRRLPPGRARRPRLCTDGRGCCAGAHRCGGPAQRRSLHAPADAGPYWRQRLWAGCALRRQLPGAGPAQHPGHCRRRESFCTGLWCVKPCCAGNSMRAVAAERYLSVL